MRTFKTIIDPTKKMLRSVSTLRQIPQIPNVCIILPIFIYVIQ